MLTEQVESAICSLQSQAIAARDTYSLERIERALDELIRNPHKVSISAHQVRSARANAGKVIERRRSLAPSAPLDEATHDVSTVDRAIASAELLIWLDAAPLSDHHRAILKALAAGWDYADLAESWSIPAARMRVQVSRARKAARDLYTAADVA